MTKRAKKIDTYISVVNKGTIQNPVIEGKVMPMTRKVYEALGTVTVKGVQYPNGGWVLKSIYDEQNPDAPKLSAAAKSIVDGTEPTAPVEPTAPKVRGRKPKTEA